MDDPELRNFVSKKICKLLKIFFLFLGGNCVCVFGIAVSRTFISWCKSMESSMAGLQYGWRNYCKVAAAAGRTTTSTTSYSLADRIWPPRLRSSVIMMTCRFFLMNNISCCWHDLSFMRIIMWDYSSWRSCGKTRGCSVNQPKKVASIIDQHREAYKWLQRVVLEVAAAIFLYI